MKYERVIKAISGECWAILPSKLEQIIGVIEARSNGIELLPHAVIQSEVQRRQPARSGSVFVLPLFGTISHRADSVQSSIGTSAEQFGKEFDAAIGNSSISAVILDIDSPGGSVSGIQELADKIRSRRGEKPIVAVANAGAFSAVYWIATDELVVTPSGNVGSVGVVAMHVDQSELDIKDGLKPTYIHAGEHKIEGHPHAPLDAQAHAEIQKRVDRHYSAFVQALAENRNTTGSRVRATFGGGRIFSGKEAVERNMADRVGTLEQVISEMTGSQSSGNRGSRRSMSAARERRRLEANRIPTPSERITKSRRGRLGRKRF
jgi:signal peptide peptidase SppA